MGKNRKEMETDTDFSHSHFPIVGMRMGKFEGAARFFLCSRTHAAFEKEDRDAHFFGVVEER